MKQIFPIRISVCFLLTLFWILPAQAISQITAASNLASPTTTSAAKPLVLLELFTAEGCPMCPAADRNLAFLEREQPFADAEIVTLALHVDYWNSRGVNDEYSSPLFSRRQSIYGQYFKIGSSYTPQMVVDGQLQFAGTDLAKAQKAIVESSKFEKGKIDFSTEQNSVGETKLRINISALPKHSVATIFLAYTEDYLASKRNNAKNATEKGDFISVVRQLKSLGTLAINQQNFELETLLESNSAWKRENLKFVVFVQENVSRKIIGIGRFILTTSQKAVS